MSEGQLFVRARLPKWDAWRLALLATVLFLGGCGDPASEAYAEAQQAQALMEQGDLPGARMAVARAMAIRDDQVDILLLDARIKYQMGDMRPAYDSFSLALAIDPNNAEALLGVAQLGMLSGNPREAGNAADRILLMEPTQPDALLIKGVQALDRRNFPEVIALGDRLIAAVPDDPRGVVLRARGLSLSGERSEALALLRDATARIGNNDMLATALLENARDQGDPAVMLEQLAYLRQSRPDSLDLAIDEANVRYKSGDLPGARRIGLEILDKFGDNARAMTRLSDLWLEYDPDPLAPAERSALASGGKLGARLTASRYYLARGEPDAATALLGSRVDAREAALTGRIALAIGKPDGAAIAEAVAKQDATDCDAQAAIAEDRLRRGNPRGAIVAAQVVAAECLDRNDGFLLLARAYAAQKHPPGVERVYREGVAARPLDRPLTAAFARWLLTQDRPDAAVSVARRLTQLVPAKVSSWQLLADICQRAGNPTCRATALAQEKIARTNFAMDLPPGERPVNALLGQSWR